jgi:peroxiredoxin
MTIITLVSILLAGLSAAQPPAPAIGAAAPAFSVTDATGTVRSLSDYRGRTVVLEWHAQSCSYVNKHYRSGQMQRLQKTWMDRGVVWLLVNSSGPDTQSYMTADETRAYLTERKIAPTAMLIDSEGTVGRAYGALTSLHMAIVDPAGRLVYLGAIDDQPRVEANSLANAKSYVDQALTELSQNKPVSIPTSEPYGCSLHYAKPGSQKPGSQKPGSQVLGFGGSRVGFRGSEVGSQVLGLVRRF